MNSKGDSMMHQLLTRKQTAAGLHVTTKTIHEWVVAGKLPAIKIGRKVLFDVEDINRLIEASRVAPRAA